MCGVSTKGCEALAEALSCNPSHLKELDLSYNYPKTSGVELLSAKWQDPDCALEMLKYVLSIFSKSPGFEREKHQFDLEVEVSSDTSSHKR